MLITSKEGVEDIERFDRDILPTFERLKSDPITEEDKVLFYSISKVYENCDIFRNYINGVYFMFVDACKDNSLKQLLIELMRLSIKKRW